MCAASTLSARFRHSVRYKRALSLVCVLAACTAPAPPADSLDDTARRARIDAMYAEYRKSFPEVESLSPEELMQRRSTESFVVVDAREPEERAVSVLPDAISRESFENKKEAYRDHTVVVYCTIGYRSGRYAESLLEEGFDARNLAGSVLAWAHAGGTFLDPEGNETRRVHVYGEDWNLLPEGYEPVW